MVSKLFKCSLLFTLVLLATSCCSGAHCPERASGGDWPRTKSKWAKKFGVVINDRVSWPKLDRTDWRYVVLPGAGKLTVQLHWDNGKANLDLSVWDEMGIKIQDGRVWGELGLKSVVAIEHPGRYYIRIRAKTEDDESTYALRVFFKVEGPVAKCDPCETSGEKKCLGSDGFQVCERQSAKCLGWGETVRCPEDTECQEGSCVKVKIVHDRKPSPPKGCKKGQRRCKGSSAYVVCASKGKWGSRAVSCPAGKRCSRGKCIHKPTPPPNGGGKKECVKGKIISMYIYQGKPTLHIQLPASHGISAGSEGVVYAGSTKKVAKNGRFKVRKVSGNYCVTSTQLKKLGQNRKVCITPK